MLPCILALSSCLEQVCRVWGPSQHRKPAASALYCLGLPCCVYACRDISGRDLENWRWGHGRAVPTEITLLTRLNTL